MLPDGTNIVTFVEHDSEPPRTGPTPPPAPRQAILLWYRLIDFLGRGADGPKEFGVAAPA